MEKYRTVRVGAMLWAVGFALFFIAQIVVGWAWENPSYSWSLNNVSDLGNVHCQMWGTEGGSTPRYVCSPLHSIMNIAFVIEGLCIISGTFATKQLWKQTRISKVARSFLILSGMGLVVAGLAPADINENVHVVLGALPIAVFGNIGLLLTGSSLKTEYIGKLRLLGPVLGIVGLIATFLFVSQNYLGLGQGGMERLWGYNFMVWTGVIGGYLLLKKVGKSGPELSD